MYAGPFPEWRAIRCSAFLRDDILAPPPGHSKRTRPPPDSMPPYNICFRNRIAKRGGLGLHCAQRARGRTCGTVYPILSRAYCKKPLSLCAIPEITVESLNRTLAAHCCSNGPCWPADSNALFHAMKNGASRPRSTPYARAPTWRNVRSFSPRLSLRP